MVKTMNNAAFTIEIARDYIKELVIILLKLSPHGIRNKVSVLNDARCFGIYE